MHFTRATRVGGTGRDYREAYDGHLLRALEQMVDRGDARLEVRDGPDDGWSYSHRLVTGLGTTWLVFDAEA